jgi:hypothetical protein
MQTIPSELQALLDGGRYGLRDAILFDLVEGTYGFWWGEGAFTWNGVTFEGCGDILRIEDPVTSTGGDEPAFTLRLSAVPNSDLTPDVLGSLRSYGYRGRPVILYRFLYSLETGEMVGTMPLAVSEGIFDVLETEDDPQGGYTLVARVISGESDLRKTGYLKRGVETQKAIAGGVDDPFYEHAASTATIRLKWGTR